MLETLVAVYQWGNYSFLSAVSFEFYPNDRLERELPGSGSRRAMGGELPGSCGEDDEAAVSHQGKCSCLLHLAGLGSAQLGLGDDKKLGLS